MDHIAAHNIFKSGILLEQHLSNSIELLHKTNSSDPLFLEILDNMIQTIQDYHSLLLFHLNSVKK